MSAITLHADPDSPLASARRRVTQMLLREKRDWAREMGKPGTAPDARGGAHLWVTDMQPSGAPTHWRAISDPSAGYAYRCVLPNQVTGDMGDHARWSRGVEETEAAADVLDDWHVRYWLSLSGGRGLHIELFLRPLWTAVYRSTFFKYLMANASERLGYNVMVEEVAADPLFEDPRIDSRVFREFGVRGVKGERPYRKTLWSDAGESRRAIPTDRDEAYRQAGLRFPKKFPVAVQPPGISHRVIQDAFGGLCPQSERCFDLKDLCDKCPATC